MSAAWLNPKLALDPHGNARAEFDIRNDSGETWRAADGFGIGYHLFDAETGTLVVDGPRLHPERDLKPGETVHVALDFALPPGQFDGPGTYSPGVMGRLTIGSQSFVGTASAVTVRADGSGHGSFTGFQHETGPAGTPESGTVKWTCAD